MLKRCFILPATLALTLAATPSLRGAVVTLNPVADAFVATGPTNNLIANNYGGAGALGLSAPGSSKGEFQTVLSFDTSGAKSTFDGLYGPGGWTVQSMTLQLTATPANNAIFNTNATGSFGVSWMQNDGWTEGTGSPNAPAATGLNYTSLQGLINPGADEALGTFSYDGSSSSTSTYTLSLPPGFTAELVAGTPISLRASAADGAVSYLFNSRSATTVANRPVLTITAVPEPGLIALLALSGLLGLAQKRRPPPPAATTRL